MPVVNWREMGGYTLRIRGTNEVLVGLTMTADEWEWTCGLVKPVRFNRRESAEAIWNMRGALGDLETLLLGELHKLGVDIEGICIDGKTGTAEPGAYMNGTIGVTFSNDLRSDEEILAAIQGAIAAAEAAHEELTPAVRRRRGQAAGTTT